MVKRSEFIWNMIGSIVGASISMILLIIITRVNGVDAGGMYSITFATATIMFAIADFGMRVYQVTDTERIHDFGTYLSARIVVDILMLAAAVLFVAIDGYDMYKALMCIGFVLFRFVDGLSETYQGEFQLNGELDIAGKSVTYRTASAMVIFLVFDIITKNMLISIYLMVAINMLVFVLYDLRKIKKYQKNKISFNYVDIKKVILACFPLFIAIFLNNYIINAPKYAIDYYLNYEMQMYFNVLYFPTFTINLMSIFILKPMLRSLGENWNAKKYTQFIKLSGKVCLLILILTIIVELICYIIGIPLLEAIFGIGLANYKSTLLVLVIAGGLSAYSVAFLYMLSTMRLQIWTSIAYGLTAIAALFLPRILVSKYQLEGAAISSVLLMLMLCTLLILVILMKWRKRRD